MVLLSTLIVPLQLILYLPSLNLRHLLLQLVLQLLQNLSLIESLTDTFHTTEVLFVFVSNRNVKLVLLLTLVVKLVLLLESLQNVLEIHLGRGRRLSSLWLVSERLKLSEVAVQTLVGFVYFWHVFRRTSPKLFLKLANEIDQSTLFLPLKDNIIGNLTGCGADVAMLHPLSNIN